LNVTICYFFVIYLLEKQSQVIVQNQFLLLCCNRDITLKINSVTVDSLINSCRERHREIVSQDRQKDVVKQIQLECGPMPNLMVALPNIGGALCSTTQSLADAHY